MSATRNDIPDLAPSVGRREANKRDKLLRIRNASREVFLAKGYEDATLREIAQVADVAFGTLFLYAKNKKDLLLLLFDEELPKASALALADAEAHDLLLDQLTAYFGQLYAFFAETPSLSRDMLREFTFTGGIVGPRLLEELHSIEQQLARLVARAQQDGHVTSQVAPGLAAHVFFSLHRIELRACLDAPELDVRTSQASLRQQLELVLSGMAPDRPAARVL